MGVEFVAIRHTNTSIFLLGGVGSGKGWIWLWEILVRFFL